MKTIDLNLEKLLKNKRTGWVAVSGDFKKIVASSKKLNDLVNKTKDMKKNIYYLPVNREIGKWHANHI